MKKLNFIQQAVAKVFRMNKFTEASSTSSGDKWVRLTDRDTKGLNLITKQRQLKLAFRMFTTNPMAKWIIKIINSFVCGDGFDYEVEIQDKKISEERKKVMVEECNEVLNRFWIANKLDLSLPKKFQDLSLNGALAMPVFVHPTDGSVKLGFVDPLNIDKVEVNPMNVEEIMQIKMLKAADGKPKILTGIKEDYNPEDLMLDQYGLLDGECFYFAVNNVTNQPEGISDLLNVLDYLDVQDQMLFSILENMKVRNVFVLDVELKGMDKTQMEAWEVENPMPTGPTRLVHNEEVVQTILSSNVQGSESHEMFRLVKNFILGAFGFPEHWYADGGNTNLATAVEQSTPTFQMLKERQQYVVFIIELILMFALHKAFNKKQGFSLTRDELKSIVIKVKAPEFQTRNLQELTTAFNTLTDALLKGVTSGYITADSAGSAFRQFLSLTGFELDEQSEIIKIEEQFKKAEEANKIKNSR